ncbi:luxQ, partial [Symbiodinium microadriaticum]
MATALVERAAFQEYLLIVHLPHSLVSVARYRDWQDSTSLPRRWLFDLIVSLFTHSMGGGISCKASLGGNKVLLEGHLPPHYLAARWDFCWVHMLTYALTYFSPADIVFRAMSGRRSPLRLMCVVADSFDAVTTLC